MLAQTALWVRGVTYVCSLRVVDVIKYITIVTLFFYRHTLLSGMYSLRHSNLQSRSVPRRSNSLKVSAKPTKSVERTKEVNWFTLGVAASSSIAILSASLVTVLTLREAQFETQHLDEEFNKLQHKVELLEEKDIQHEIVIEALVSEILKLREIGIV